MSKVRRGQGAGGGGGEHLGGSCGVAGGSVGCGRSGAGGPSGGRELRPPVEAVRPV